MGRFLLIEKKMIRSKEKELKAKIQDLGKVFDLQKVLNVKSNKEYIKKYYRINKFPYSLFHTTSGLIYMGISRDGKYNHEDLLEHARIIQSNINSGTKKVLELATGRGASSAYLAEKFPNVEFYGIDISNSQLEFARRKARKLKNYFPDNGDYHNLKKFKSSFFDIVFIIEALCYSENKEKVFGEAYRVLKKGGLFIVFDGYYQRKNSLGGEQILAQKLVAKGMALNNIESYSEFLKKAKTAKFKLLFEEDLSSYVIPTMERFERIAKRFLKFSKVFSILFRLFPKEFTYNVVSAYLMPYLFKNKLAFYKLTMLKK